MANFEEMAMLFAVNNVEEHQNNFNNAHHERQTRNKEMITDPFKLTDRLFIKNFRLTKDVVKDLIILLSPHLSNSFRSSAIDLNTKIFVTLNFLATGSYQSPIGNSRFMGLSQPSVSRCISEVVTALNLPEIFNAWVKFPKNINELNDIRNGFYRNTGFPGVVGCIDCTHVAITPPSTNLNLNENQHPEYIYVNRKGYHSINVQLICDSNLKILNVNALFPGNTHDTHVWNNKNYNRRQMSTRSIIERCNGVLKMRFRCLLRDRTLHYKPEKASSIINACVVLHNMCITNNVPMPDDPNIEDLDNLGMVEDQDFLADFNRNIDLTLGRQQRNRVIRYLSHRNVI
ncbi:unnamed protein product [Macrosiphum euphorbiae]|uniref:DDE Tnp4 domain-containing protein n=1 Tax=Macrosiphum euphorbiae TaxID=13131 RepID=A0AAV0XZT8_9HEMI|nr:unnamed protein product [Macrosiphum euphorbiae]